MKFSRGLAALIFAVFFQTTLTAEYLYKDDVVNNPKFTQEIESLGQELYEKTGIALRLVMIRDLPDGIGIIEYEQNLLKEFNEPTVLMTFAELNSEVDILVSETSLYKHFDKGQVLSPVASTAQAVAMAFFFADSFENFKELASDSGGTILPLLGAKAKAGEVVGKYSAAMYNGYLDVARQIAESNNAQLKHGNGQGSRYVMIIIKTLFYGIILMGIVMYIRKKIFERRNS